MKTYLIKKRNTAFLLLASLFIFSSCDDEVLRGHGDVVSRTRPVGNFSAVDAGGEFEIYLKQGPAEDILLEGQANVLTEVSTHVRNNKLYIEFDRKRVRLNRPVKIYLTTPELTGISVSGANSVRGLNEFQVDDLDIRASGNSTIYLNVKNAHTIESDISGSVNMELNGDAQHQEIDISGSGNIQTFGLSTKTADIEISGSGKCDVSVTDKIEAKLSGSGRVRYKGNPAVSTKISGSGSVVQVD
ncbi:DUF2807 domain-containing protein [Adhaeribacter swui]|uniref:DUF2807 domain-containing protein n=1 Tax=Adhaeribacter swui TaxID=2086471 RepID=A0A7G7GDC1_9BACT|nr:head GIN domain-containing protein [Adhaeribacter swui]QNF35155.1 DUF2807 domain-containing protein [Adhaeribacter swui]